jgi:iron complex outermembrane receptor protein
MRPSRYDDIQLIFRQGVVPLLFNAGNATINGFEAEFGYRPNSRLVFEGGFSTRDDEIKSMTPVPGTTATVAPDDELPLTPSFQGNLALAVSVWTAASPSRRASTAVAPRG